MSLLNWAGLVEVTRRDRIVIARFERPHRVLATSPAGGGQREDVTAVYNHQSCEPAGDRDGCVHKAIGSHTEQLHLERCAHYGLDPERTVSLGTAANMRCLGLAVRDFRDLRVAAVCTAGVEGNAGRAGDPASTFEWDGRYESVAAFSQPSHGTIVTMLFIDHELTAGALARSLMMATEAKTAVLQNLLVGSRYSPGLATGTGTDQFMGACPIGVGTPLRGAGKHVVTGQLIAEAVAEAIESALVLQNGLDRPGRRLLTVQLGRFGVTEELLRARAAELLPAREANLFAANLLGIDADPQVAAAAAGLATVADQLRTGVLPSSCAEDYAATAGALLALAASGGQADYGMLHDRLRDQRFELTELVPRALCLGYAEKWRDLHRLVDQAE